MVETILISLKSKNLNVELFDERIQNLASQLTRKKEQMSELVRQRNSLFREIDVLSESIYQYYIIRRGVIDEDENEDENEEEVLER